MRRKVLFAACAVGVAAVTAAEAKFAIRLTLSDATPVVAQEIRVAVQIPERRAEGAVMRVVAVPPGMSKYQAIRQERRYGIPLTQEGATWRGSVRFRRAGVWLLVVPNWGAPGYSIPPPVQRTVRVRPGG